MKQMKKLTAIALLIAMLLTCVSAFAEMKETVAVEKYLHQDIDEVGSELSLQLIQEQSDEAYMTMYDNEDITIGGRDGVVVDITFFTNDYTLYGVTVGMTLEEAEAELDARGIPYKEDRVVEIDQQELVFEVPGDEGVVGSFSLNDGVVDQATLRVETDDAEEEQEEAAPAPAAKPASKATAPVKKTGYIKLTGESHLRKKADKESKSYGVIAKDSKLKFTATAKDNRGVTWYKVKAIGNTGWVSSKYTKKISKAEYEKNDKKPHYKEKKANGVIRLLGKVNVRKYPDKGSKSLSVFAKDSELKYTATSKDERGVTWYKVTADGVTGWISSKNAKKIK